MVGFGTRLLHDHGIRKQFLKCLQSLLLSKFALARLRGGLNLAKSPLFRSSELNDRWC